jgi:hypothetical protein
VVLRHYWQIALRAIGAPHCGHDSALSDTCLPHSEHLISAISQPSLANLSVMLPSTRRGVRLALHCTHNASAF